MGVVKGLAGQIDLETVEAAGVVSGLQLLDAVAQGSDVRVLIANDLRRLQEADVTARLLGAGTAGDSKALTAVVAAATADAAEAAGADAAEALEAAAAEHAAAAIEAIAK